MKDRMLKIREFIDRYGKVTIKELEGAFPEISSMTIRRDLQRLEEDNAVLRIAGGALSVNSVLRAKETDFSERINYNTAEKTEIADKATRLVEPKSCIFIDGGSTTTYFARALPDDNFYVITNAFTIAETVLRKNKPTVTILGGDVKKNNFITVGRSCAEFLREINIQTAVMTATGFIRENSAFTCGSQSEAEVKRAVIKKASKVIMLLDSSKVDKNTPYTFATIEDIDCLVTDEYFPKGLSASITERGIKVY